MGNAFSWRLTSYGPIPPVLLVSQALHKIWRELLGEGIWHAYRERRLSWLSAEPYRFIWMSPQNVSHRKLYFLSTKASVSTERTTTYTTCFFPFSVNYTYHITVRNRSFRVGRKVFERLCCCLVAQLRLTLQPLAVASQPPLSRDCPAEYWKVAIFSLQVPDSRDWTCISVSSLCRQILYPVSHLGSPKDYKRRGE